MNTTKIEKKSVKMIAHRGVSGLETENTAAAFVAAGNRSYWGIETDVHRTLDGKMILVHDSNTSRVANEERIVEESRFEDLRNLLVKDFYGEGYRNDLRLPSLTEYVRICKKYEKKAILELKSQFTKEDIETILRQIGEEDYLDNMIFISFHLQNLISLREICPDCTVQCLLKKIDEDGFEILKKYRMDLDIDYRALTKEWIDRVHGEGLIVNCWTVNDAEVAERLISWGIDQITTNILE